MKLIFKVDGHDFLRIPEPVLVPQIGWTVKWMKQKFKVADIEMDYDIPEDEEKLIIHLQNDFEVKSDVKQVQVRKVWSQSKDNLTLHKVYEIIDEDGIYFTIITDNGKPRKYKKNNYQFRHL